MAKVRSSSRLDWGPNRERGGWEGGVSGRLLLEGVLLLLPCLRLLLGTTVADWRGATVCVSSFPGGGGILRDDARLALVDIGFMAFLLRGLARGRRR